MKHCQKYSELAWMDQKEMQAKIIYLLQNDEFSFDGVTQLIRLAEAVGLFQKVKFGSQVNDNSLNTKSNAE